MKVNRWAQRQVARAGGYFWIPCPVCDRPFGGHEQHGPSLKTGHMTGKITCGRGTCPDETRRINAASGYNAPLPEGEYVENGVRFTVMHFGRDDLVRDEQ